MMLRWAALLLGLIGAPVGPACAHAVLVETAPEDSSRLESAPADLRLRFNEPVRPVGVRLVDGRGRTVLTSVRQSDTSLVLVPAAALVSGGYVLAYRVMSDDGHPVAGTIRFGVAAAPPAGEEPPAPDAALLTGLEVAARAAQYGGLLVAVGGALFVVLVGSGPAGVIRLAAAVAVAAALAGAGLSGVVANGLPAAGLLDLAPWLTGLGGTPGQSALVGAVGLGLLVTGLARGWRALLLAGALVAAASLALTGHAAAAPPAWLAAMVVLGHVLVAAFWVGSLWPLVVALRSLPEPVALEVVQRFSRLALVAVPVLLAAGGGLTLLQGGAGPAALATGYGGLWLVKMALVALLLGVAALNRWRLTPALAAHRPAAAQNLIRAIGCEAALAGLVLVVTAGLGATPPPRALAVQHKDGLGGHEPMPAAAAAVGYAALATAPAGSAVIEVEPARVGGNAVTVRLTNPAGAALDAAGVRLELSQPGRVPVRHDLSRRGPGTFSLSNLGISSAGSWDVSVEADTAAGPVLFRAVLLVAAGPVSGDGP